jgi:hypothetical protein
MLLFLVFAANQFELFCAPPFSGLAPEFSSSAYIRSRFASPQQPLHFQPVPHSFALFSWKPFIINLFPKTTRGYTPSLH